MEVSKSPSRTDHFTPEGGADDKQWIGSASLLTGLVFPDIEPCVLGLPTRNR
jgi:hypothetical protein